MSLRVHEIRSIWPFATAAFVGVLTTRWLVGMRTDAPGPLTVLAVAGGVLIMLVGPRMILATIVVLAILAPFYRIGSIGDVDIRSWDPFFVALLLWAPLYDRPDTAWLRPLRVFLGVAAVSLLVVGITDELALRGSVISWLRLAETVQLAWLVPRFLRSERDVRRLIQLLIVSGMVAVLLVATLGVTSLSTAVLAEERAGFVFNVNTLGLISGLLVLSYFWSTWGSRLMRFVPAAVGLLGFALTKSVGSTLAVTAAVTAVVLWRTRSDLRVVKAIGVLILVGTLGYSFVRFARPEAIPGSDSFAFSSVSQRVVFARAGLVLFIDYPMLGFGWQHSTSGIESSEVRAQISEPEKVEWAFSGPPRGVHNAYIQILAETGLIGLYFFLRALRSMSRTIRALLKDPTAVFLAGVLVLVLVWWNESPIFGSQTETMVFALVLGLIAAWRLGSETVRRIQPPLAGSRRVAQHI